MPFTRILVAIDGSDCSNRAFATALELAQLAKAHLTALAVEGPLPMYAATIGEVEEAKREKDVYFTTLGDTARTQAAAAGITLEVDVRPGHPAELISRVAKEGGYDLGARCGWLRLGLRSAGVDSGCYLFEDAFIRVGRDPGMRAVAHGIRRIRAVDPALATGNIGVAGVINIESKNGVRIVVALFGAYGSILRLTGTKWIECYFIM